MEQMRTGGIPEIYSFNSEITLPKTRKTTKARKSKRKLETFDASKHFWPYVDISAGPDGCHPWTGHRDPGNGYGRLWNVEGLPYAHRVAWELANGRKVPRGKMVLHTCVGNRCCCNYRHHYIGSPADNVADMKRQGRIGRKTEASVVMAIVRARYPAFPILVKGARSYPDIASEFGLDPNTVYRICTGKRHRKLTGITGAPGKASGTITARAQQREAVV